MKLSSILMLCSGLINAGIAAVFYSFAVVSYLGNWLQIAGWQLIIGIVFTVVSGGSFLASRHYGKTRSVFGDVALVLVALAELLFSLPWLFFAFAAGDLSLLEYGIPFMGASIFLLVGCILRWRETKHRGIPEEEPVRMHS
jgi:hypothetical protein